MSRIGLFAIGVLLLSVFGASSPASAQAADPVCTAVTQFAAGARPNLPQPIDDITEVVDMVADCDARVLTFILNFLVPADQLLPTAIEDARRAFLVGSCEQGIAASTGWTLAGEFRAPDGTVSARFDTTADDCATLAATAPVEVGAYVADVAAAFPAPVVIDDTLEIFAARADGTTLVLAVHASGPLGDTDTVRADLAVRLTPVLCTTSQITALFGVGAGISVTVVDDGGRDVLTMPIDPAACEAAFAAAAPDVGPDPAELAALCANANSVVADMQAALPILNDDGTETTAVAFDCPTGTLTLSATFTGPTDLYAGAALADREAYHDIQHCALDGLAPGLGVAVVTEVRGLDGALLATLTTTPPECDFITPAMVADAMPRLSAEALAEQLAMIVEANRSALPAQINDRLSIVGMFNGPNVLVLFYQISGDLTPEQTAAAADQFRAQIVARDCADPSQLQLLRAGASFSYRYSDTQSNALFSITVAPADCGL